MAGVVFIFVREDASDAEALAEAFDAAGFSITGNNSDSDALAVVIWSRKALRSLAFCDAAERALSSGRAVVASLIAAPPSDLSGAPVVDLSAWDGEDGVALDPLIEAAGEIMRPGSPNVIALPSQLVYEDAEFVELAPRRRLRLESQQAARSRRSWETPIPADVLHPVCEAPREKLGAPSPRQDFRRLRARHGHPRAHAALAFAVVALLGGGVIALNAAHGPAPRAPVAQAQIQAVDTGGVSLTSASLSAAGLEDVAPTEAPSSFDVPVQVGHRGLEPPSARQIRRASYSPRYSRGDDRAAYEPSALIPDAVTPRSPGSGR